LRTLVLGGGGFIGSHLVNRLLNCGHSVRSFDRSYDKRICLEGIDYITGDFNDQNALANVLDDVDIVFHLISTTNPATSNLDPVADVSSNLVGTINLLELMRDKEINRIVYLSSGGTVYGNPEKSPMSEDHCLKPICSYGVVKVAIEKYLYLYQELYGLEAAILRPSNLYGPLQRADKGQGVIAAFLENIHKNKSINIWGDGSVIIDYLYVDDLIDLCVMLMESNSTGVYNAGAGKGISLSALIETIREVTDSPVEINYEKGRSFDVKEVVLDIKKANKELAWSPKVDLKEGIRKHRDWIFSR